MPRSRSDMQSVAALDWMNLRAASKPQSCFLLFFFLFLFPSFVELGMENGAFTLRA